MVKKTIQVCEDLERAPDLFDLVRTKAKNFIQDKIDTYLLFKLSLSTFTA